MQIKRDGYLKQLIDYSWDGQVKVITGIRRCGKSYLLNTLYREYLLSSGVPDDHIISIALDLAKDIRYRDPLALAADVRQRVSGSGEKYYLFVDEIQMSDEVKNPYNPDGKKITFYDAMNDLRSLPNLDIYVTGSNSKMLSSDILTEFRGRSDEIRMHPLSFREYYSAVGGDKYEAFDSFALFGGMPMVLSRPDDEAKGAYLRSLFTEVYIKDIVDRKKISRVDILSDLLDLLCSSVGSLTNPTNAANSINTMKKLRREEQVSQNTVKTYFDHLTDAFLFSECRRFDVKGKAYFDYPNKYYCEDVGLRNARIGFRQQEPAHIMENVIYNELIARRYAVDIGIVYSGEVRDGKQKRVAREIDFIASSGGRKLYIQSAFAMETDGKRESELKPFSLTGDSFPKIIVRRDVRRRWYDDTGVLHIGLEDFLLDESQFFDFLS